MLKLREKTPLNQSMIRQQLIEAGHAHQSVIFVKVDNKISKFLPSVCFLVLLLETSAVGMPEGELTAVIRTSHARKTCFITTALSGLWIELYNYSCEPRNDLVRIKGEPIDRYYRGLCMPIDMVAGDLR